MALETTLTQEWSNLRLKEVLILPSIHTESTHPADEDGNEAGSREWGTKHIGTVTFSMVAGNAVFEWPNRIGLESAVSNRRALQ
ncbi:MAG: hypothetical protein KDN22_01285 [Verrucomicrobiae bacterium]|nr:hypothetical protein [Verrucomicrobiae bacterium]